MKTDLDFKSFYHEQLLPELDVVEKKRFSILIQLAITSVIVLGFFGAYAYTFAIIWQAPLMLALYIPTFGFVLLAAYKTFDIIIKNTSFYDYFKKNIIFKTILYMNPAMRYDKKYFISKDQFFNSEIFKEEKVKYKGDDYVVGNLEEDVTIEFSELHIKYVDKDLIKEKKTETMFLGIFYKARLPFIFPINFVIEPLNFSSEIEKGILYKTGIIEFDSKFQIRILKKNHDYNPSLVLTDEFLNGIVKFSEKFLNEVHISFVENNIYAAIHHDKELFEPLVFSSNKKFDLIHMHYQDLSFPINLIKNVIINQALEELAA
ncbi:MAG: DUF3137 domain-containing protein [Opitutaceae bacterium]|nr:DUF3137 domain-containing protein [Cytophagales bacterium]